MSGLAPATARRGQARPKVIDLDSDDFSRDPDDPNREPGRRD
jgi:hypothetical protein